MQAAHDWNRDWLSVCAETAQDWVRWDTCVRELVYGQCRTSGKRSEACRS